MGHVFSHNSKWYFRLWVWLKLFPSYIWPKPIESAPLTDEERAMLEDEECR